MAIKIGGYSFEGPLLLSESCRLRNQSGVYAILTLNWNEKYDVVDVGETEKVKTRVESHNREYCWLSNNKNGLFVTVLYCGESDRMRIEQELRRIFNPVCGEK